MKWVCGGLFLLAWLNFMVFTLVGLSIGGGAIHGKVVNGRYYLRNHGKYAEVSHGVFDYSRLHAYAVWITHPIGMVAGGMLVWLHVRRKKDAAANPGVEAGQDA